MAFISLAPRYWQQVIYSVTTPTRLIYDKKAYEGSAALMKAFEKKPSVKQGVGFYNRAVFWASMDGVRLRLNPMIDHIVEALNKQTTCFWCETRSRNGVTCLFCGENSCSDSCNRLFYTYFFACPPTDPNPPTGPNPGPPTPGAKEEEEDEEDASIAPLLLDFATTEIERNEEIRKKFKKAEATATPFHCKTLSKEKKS